MPFSVTTAGLPEALDAIDRVAVRAPVALGVNVSVTAQFAPAARELGQALAEMAKSPEFVPPSIKLLKVIAELEVL